MMDPTDTPWGLVILSFTLWFLGKPLWDPRSYVKFGAAFILPSLVNLVFSTQDCLTFTVHLTTWIIIYTFIFWPTVPAGSLYKNETPVVWTAWVLSVSWSLFRNTCLSKTGTVVYLIVSVLLWKTGGNYVNNRPKSIGLGVLCSLLVSGGGVNVTTTLPFIWLSLLVYCNIERCISMRDTWPKLCPSKGFLTDIIFILLHVKDADLPQGEISDIRNTFDIFYKPKNLNEAVYGTILLTLSHAERLLVAPIAIMMRRLDDVTDDQASHTKEEALKQLDEARCFFEEIFQGRVQDWEFGYWPRPQGTGIQVNVERYIKSLPTLEPSVLRLVVSTSDYIPPKVPYDIVESFVWERSNGVATTEEDLLWWCSKTSIPIGHMTFSAAMSRHYLHPRPFLPERYRPRYLEVMKLSGYITQMLDNAIDVADDIEEGKVLIPKDWMLEDEHFEILRVTKDPWALGKDTLQVYALRILEKAVKYADKVSSTVDKSLVEIFPKTSKRVLLLGPTLVNTIYEVKKEQKVFVRHFFQGNYLKLLFAGFKMLYLPAKTPYGWLIFER